MYTKNQPGGSDQLLAPAPTLERIPVSQKLDRRTAITALATGAVALPSIANAMAEPIDPMFALLEAHRQARVRSDEAIAGKLGMSCDEEAADAAVAVALKAIYECDATTTTPKGAYAMAKYSLDDRRKYEGEEGVEAEGHLIAIALERMLGQMAVA